MRVLVIGDPHFQKGNNKFTDALVNESSNAIDKYNPDIVVILGDVLHNFEQLHTDPLTRAYSFFTEISLKKKTFLLIGNHDIGPVGEDCKPEYTKHPFVGMANENFIIANKIIEWNGFVFCPYYPPGKLIQMLDASNIDWKGATCLFAHQEFKGCALGPIKSEHGDIWLDEYPLMISGHIHGYDELQGNLIYTGSPFQTTFGESSDKSISLFTFGDDITHERIKLNIPKKITMNVSDKELKTMTIDMFNKIDEYRVVIKCDVGDEKMIHKIPIVMGMKRRGIKVMLKTKMIVNKSIDTNSKEDYYTRLYKSVSKDLQSKLRELFT